MTKPSKEKVYRTTSSKTMLIQIRESSKVHVAHREKILYTQQCPPKDCWSYNAIKGLNSSRSEVKESELCKHCLRTALKAGLIEEVKKVEKVAEETPADEAKHCKECGFNTEYCQCSYTRVSAELETLTKELGDLKTNYKEVNALNNIAAARCKELSKELDKLARLRPFLPYLEHADAILAALPPIASLQGHKLEWRSPKAGEEYWNTVYNKWKNSGDPWQHPRWIRTPIIKYIPTEHITDELVAVLGRLECRMFDHVAVEAGEHTDIIIGVGNGKFLDIYGDGWEYCSIKEQAVIDAYNRLSEAAKAEVRERLPWLKGIV